MSNMHRSQHFEKNVALHFLRIVPKWLVFSLKHRSFRHEKWLQFFKMKIFAN